jgi:hypothetical protein
MDIEKFIRPSAIGQLSACPGAALMQAATVYRYGSGNEGKAAAAGTYGHAAIALSLSQGSRELMALSTLVADEFTIACAKRALHFAWSLIDSLAIEPANILIEHHLAAESFGLPRGGTADLILVQPYKKVTIVDWKFSFDDQGDAVDHDQLAAYSLAAAETFSVEKVEAILFCAREAKDKRATRAAFDADTLRSNAEWVKEVTYRAREQLTAARNGMALETKAGYAQCRYCKALPYCKTARKYMSDALEFQELIGPTTPAEWGALADAAKLADAFAEQGKDAVKRHIAGGGHATGWKLQDGRQMTRIEAMHAMQLAQAAGELPRLLQFASFKSEAADVIESISAAVSVTQSAPSLRPDKKGRSGD